MVNKYDNPAIQPVRDRMPDVVALPFEAIANNIKMREDTYNKNRDYMTQVKGNLAAMGKALQVDQAALQKRLKEYDDASYKIVEEAGGDYSRISDGIRDLAYSAQQDMTSGTIAAVRTSLEARNAELENRTKLFDETHASGAKKFTEASKAAAEREFIRYNAKGGVSQNEDGSYNTYQGKDMNPTIDVNKISEDYINGFKPDAISLMYTKGNYDFVEEYKSVTGEDLRTGLKRQLLNQSGFEAQLQDEFTYEHSQYYNNEAAIEGFLEKGDYESAMNLKKQNIAYLEKQKQTLVAPLSTELLKINNALEKDPKNKELLEAKKSYIENINAITYANTLDEEVVGILENGLYESYANKRIDELISPYVSKGAYEEISKKFDANPYALLARKIAGAKSLQEKVNTVPTVVTTGGSMQEVHDEDYMQNILSTQNATILSSKQNLAKLVKESGSPDVLQNAYKQNMTVQEFVEKYPDIPSAQYSAYIKESDNMMNAEATKARVGAYRNHLLKTMESNGTFKFNPATSGTTSSSLTTPYLNIINNLMRSAFDRGITPEELRSTDEFKQVEKIIDEAHKKHIKAEPMLTTQISRARVNADDRIFSIYENNYNEFSKKSKAAAASINISGGISTKFQTITNPYLDSLQHDISTLIGGGPLAITGIDGSYLGDAIYAGGDNGNKKVVPTGNFKDGKPIFQFEVYTGEDKTKKEVYGTFDDVNTLGQNMEMIGNSMISTSTKPETGTDLKVLRNAYSGGGVAGVVSALKGKIDPSLSYGLAYVGAANYNRQIIKLNTSAPITRNKPVTSSGLSTDPRLVQIPLGDGVVYIGRNESASVLNSNYSIYYKDGNQVKQAALESEGDLYQVLGLFNYDPSYTHTKGSTTSQKVSEAGKSNEAGVKIILDE